MFFTILINALKHSIQIPITNAVINISLILDLSIITLIIISAINVTKKAKDKYKGIATVNNSLNAFALEAYVALNKDKTI